jgi:hypothetical protein
MMHKALKRALAATAAPLAIAGTIWGSTAAVMAAPTTVTAVTHVVNRPDGGNGGNWAYDNLKRTLTVTVAATQKPADTLAGLTDYTATVTDEGGFSTIGGAPTPNQFVPGTQILHNGVKGSINGGISYTVTAPSGDTLTGTVPVYENDNFSTTGAGFTSTGNWPKLAFASQTGVTVAEGNDWSWKYATACESWTDSAVNGDGNTANDGNITGKICPETILFDGHGTTVAPTRENVTFMLKGVPSEVMFKITGPGPINGHVGYVNAHEGLNTGVYTGLEANHTYTSCYTPVLGGPGSTTPAPGHGGCITFITNS